MIVLLYTNEKIVCIKRGVTMNTNSLKTFIAVCEHAGFSAAAKELGYTQSTVSSQIKQLEASEPRTDRTGPPSVRLRRERPSSRQGVLAPAEAGSARGRANQGGTTAFSAVLDFHQGRRFSFARPPAGRPHSPHSTTEKRGGTP